MKDWILRKVFLSSGRKFIPVKKKSKFKYYLLILHPKVPIIDCSKIILYHCYITSPRCRCLRNVGCTALGNAGGARSEERGARIEELTQCLSHFQTPCALYLTAVKREKFAKNKKNTVKERLAFSLFKV